MLPLRSNVCWPRQCVRAAVSPASFHNRQPSRTAGKHARVSVWKGDALTGNVAQCAQAQRRRDSTIDARRATRTAGSSCTLPGVVPVYRTRFWAATPYSVRCRLAFS